METKTKVAVRGAQAASTFRVSALMMRYGITSGDAKQIKAGAILSLAPERASALCNDGICYLCDVTDHSSPDCGVAEGLFHKKDCSKLLEEIDGKEINDE
jgi:hypothetical protein